MIWGVSLLLVALVWMVFRQAGGFEFVNYDDADNVLNTHVAAGLNWNGIGWAFSPEAPLSQVARWAPLTAISHMADCQLYGSQAGGHHLTNVALQAAAAVLLFLAMRGMTGALWRSAFVAAVFAVHPLCAEVVAWVSARGDLLAGVFFMLALLAYGRHARGAPWSAWYWAVAGFYALGLLCKPTLVTLPVVVLLLDYWPLGRFAKRDGERSFFGIPTHLIVEKIPLFLLAIASCAVAVWAQRVALTPIEKLPLSSRVGNGLVSCVIYARQMVYPFGLAVFYPHPKENLPVWQAAGALLLLGIVTAAVYVGRRRFPYALAGWCWYLVMLLPVLGIVETGAQAHADRYTYLPQIGLYLMAAWGVANLTVKWNDSRAILGAGAGLLVALLAFRARDQVSCWKDSVALWRNAVECTGPNSIAQNNLGSALLQQGRLDEALVHLRKAVEIEPSLADAHLSLGNALLKESLPDDAIAEYRRALDLRPDFVKAHINLGNALLEKGLSDEAIGQYKMALEIDPDSADAHNNLGEALRRAGHLDDAIAQFRKALELRPGYPSAISNLALAQRQKEEAGSDFR